MIEGNLAVHPERRRDFEALDALVGFAATDIDESATLRFERGRVVVARGLAPGRAVTITSDSTTILELSNLRIGPLGLPVYYDENGRAVAGKLLRRQLRVTGLLRHVPTLNRVTRLFSVR